MDCDEKLNTDERDGCRSLLCDSNGIIIAEMVYRCMQCSNVNDFMGEARKHYHDKHMERELIKNYSSTESKKSRESRESRDDSENWNCNGKLVDSCPKKRGSNGKPKVSSSTATESCTRSGYITCPVCSSTRFYTTLQRRYGQFTCVACYRFFKEFFIKPKKYSCPTLGKCPLDVKSKCKGCWIYSCINIYSVDERRKTILEENRPYKYPTPDSSTVSSLSPSSDGRNYCVKQEESDEKKLDNEADDEEAFEESFDEEGNGDCDEISTGECSEKNLCCLQCTNCLAEDCGTCINCMDEPKFKGSFDTKKRCVNKKCLLK